MAGGPHGGVPQQSRPQTFEEQRQQIQINAALHRLTPRDGQISNGIMSPRPAVAAMPSGVQNYTPGEPHRNIPTPTIPQKRQRNSIPVMPSLKPRATLVDAYLTTLTEQGRPAPSFDHTRIRILRDACESEDAFYVATHQLFCAWDVDPANIMTLKQVHHSINPLPSQNSLWAGFQQLSCVMRTNADLDGRTLTWFAAFPTPLADLVRTSEPYRRIILAALNFISRLGDEWPQLSADCRERNYPPLVEEFVTRLGLTSKVLQLILFTASRRNLNVNDQDADIAQKFNDLFQQDQTEYDRLVARVNTDRPPMPRELQDRRGRLAVAYSTILSQFYSSRDSVGSLNDNAATTRPRSATSGANMPLSGPPVSHSSAPTTSVAAAPELSAAAQSMSLDSPNLNTGAFTRPTSRPIPPDRQPSGQGIQASGQPYSPITTTQEGDTNDQAPIMNGHLESRNNALDTGTPLDATQASVLQQVNAQLQSVEARLYGLHTQYQGAMIPSHLARQEQALLQRRAELYNQRALLLSGQTSQQTRHHAQQNRGQHHLQNGAYPTATQPPVASIPSNMHSTQTPPNFSQNSRVNGHHGPNNARRTNASLNPTSLNNSYGPTIAQPRGALQNMRQNHPPLVSPLQPNSENGFPPAPPSQQQHPQQQLNSNGALPNPNVLPLVEYEDAYKHVPIQNWPLIPPLHVIHRAAPPDPNRTALHQSHLRSPTFVPKTPFPTGAKSEKRYYQVVKSFVQAPSKLVAKQPVREITFSITQEDYSLIGRSRTVDRAGQIPERECRTGALQYRMRCIQRNKTSTECTEAEFVVSDTVWPVMTVFQIKGYPEAPQQQLELRRKASHGKDLPVDLTAYIQYFQPGINVTLTISILGRPKCYQDSSFFFAIEIIEIFDHDQLMNTCQQKRVAASLTLEKLKASLGGGTSLDDDDEISMVSSEITLDLTDPFSARIFTIPVRGNTCLHRECFDLETFLLSRISKPTKTNIKQPTLVDVWRCPICNRDARPMSLVVDEFLEDIRKKLVEMGLLQVVKSILVNRDGLWKPKMESGRGAAGGDDDSDSGSDGDGATTERRRKRKSTSANRVGGGAGAGERLVIDLSD